MPSQDEIMQQIVELVRAGAGGGLTPAVESALRMRYYDWIVETKEGNYTTPQDIWGTDDGKKMQEQIGKIGNLLAEKKQANLGEADCHNACRTVESASLCPHCPDDPTG